MNQILSMNSEDNQKKKTKKYKVNTGEKAEIETIIKIFAIIIIVFGITLIGKSTYGIILNTPKQKDNPQVNMEKMGSKVTLTVTTEKPIKELSFKWNDGEATTVQGDGTVNINQTISIPNGNNILKLTIIDYYNNKTYYQNQYIRESSDDTEPTIELSISGTKLKVLAKDETEISYMTYSWNDGENVRVDAEKGAKEISKEIDVQKGQNKLTVSAYDSEENKATRTETIVGANKPTFTISTEEGNIVIAAKDNDGIKKITVTVDDKTTDSGDTSINKTELTAKMPISSGTHTIKVTVTNINGLSETKEITATI